MKYVCLVYQDEVIVQNLPKEEMGKLNAEYRAVAQATQKSGQVVMSKGFPATGAATTVRVRDGKTLATDGPFAETKEELGSIYIVEVKDLDEAIQFAAEIPSAKFGSTEVRPVWG